MANDNLKNAIHQAGMTAEQFADIIRVDPKTVQRWLAGRTPYPRHRATIALALDATEHGLWPDDVPPPSSEPGSDEPGAPAGGDVIRSWAQATDPGAPDLVTFVSQADDRLDLLDDGIELLRTLGLAAALVERALAGCQVRMLTTAPRRELEPLIGQERIELRVFEVPPGHTLARAGDQLLLGLCLGGDGDRPRPLLQLHPTTERGLFDRLADHYELLWDHAGQILTDPRQLAAYLPNDNEDGEDPGDASEINRDKLSAGKSPGVPGRAGNPASPATGQAPRRWPRRPG